MVSLWERIPNNIIGIIGLKAITPMTFISRKGYRGVVDPARRALKKGKDP